MSILCKPLTDEEANRGAKSVDRLNEEIAKRFPDLSNIRLIAWASDLHLHQFGGYSYPIGATYDYADCTRQFSLCLHEINALEKRPDFIALGGDITDLGLVDEWKEFARIMSLGICNIPTIPIMGNHDHLQPGESDKIIKAWQEIRQPGWSELGDYDELYYSIVVNGIKYIVVDTVKLPNVVMSDRQKEFLALELKDTKHKIMIFQHAQMLPSGNWTDGGPYLDKDMINLINDSPHVLGVFSGHTHKPSLWKYRNKFYGTFTAVGYGIGSSTGWGGIILDEQEHEIKGVFYKELFGESYDDCTGHRNQKGDFVFMEPKSFEKDPLLNPFFWYRDPDPSKRV